MGENEHKFALSNLSDKIKLQKQMIDSKEELLLTQRKYIQELETRLKK